MMCVWNGIKASIRLESSCELVDSLNFVKKKNLTLTLNRSFLCFFKAFFVPHIILSLRFSFSLLLFLKLCFCLI